MLRMQMHGLGDFAPFILTGGIPGASVIAGQAASAALPAGLPGVPSPPINPNAPAGSQITIGVGIPKPWYKTWWGMLGIGAVGFLAYKRFVAK